MPPAPVRTPNKRTVAALPETSRLRFLLAASKLFAHSVPEASSHLGVQALKWADLKQLPLPRGSASQLCRQCGAYCSSEKAVLVKTSSKQRRRRKQVQSGSQSRLTEQKIAAICACQAFAKAALLSSSQRASSMQAFQAQESSMNTSSSAAGPEALAAAALQGDGATTAAEQPAAQPQHSTGQSCPLGRQADAGAARDQTQNMELKAAPHNKILTVPGPHKFQTAFLDAVSSLHGTAAEADAHSNMVVDSSMEPFLSHGESASALAIVPPGAMHLTSLLAPSVTNTQAAKCVPGDAASDMLPASGNDACDTKSCFVSQQTEASQLGDQGYTIDHIALHEPCIDEAAFNTDVAEAAKDLTEKHAGQTCEPQAAVHDVVSQDTTAAKEHAMTTFEARDTEEPQVAAVLQFVEGGEAHCQDEAVDGNALNTTRSSEATSKRRKPFRWCRYGRSWKQHKGWHK